MNDPLISVLLPVYNEENYISQAIDSILEQTYKNFELIVVDDCSTDNSSHIINSYSDTRIKYIKNDKNFHIAKSLNIGFKHANGPFIARMDGNDIAVHTRFEKQVNHLIHNPNCGAVFSPVLKIDNNGNSLDIVNGKYMHHELIQTYLFYKCCFFHSTAMMRKSSLPKTPYDVKNFAEDYGLWIKLVKDWELHIIDDVLMRVRDLPGGLRTTKEIVKSYQKTKLRQLGWLGLTPDSKEAKIHLGLERKKVEDNEKDNIEKIEWLNKLFLANNKRKIFREPYFSNKLLEHWNTIINNINTHSINTFMVYLRSPLKKVASKPIERTLKIFFSIFSPN